MKSLIGLSRSLFSDLRRLHPDVRGLDRDLHTVEARIESEGVGFLSVALPAFGKALDQSLAAGKMVHVPGFARDGQIPRLFSGIVTHIFDPKTGVVRSSPPFDAIVSIRQVCYFFKKFLPPDTRESVLESRALEDFYNTDMEIRDVDLSRLSRFGHVCSFVLPGLDFVQDFKCKHGPGAVLEGYTPNQKWQEVYQGLLDFDPRLLRIGYDLQASLLADWHCADRVPQYDSSSLCARLVTVPKSSVALRTITVEPTLNQFVQQGLNTVLRQHIAVDPVLKHCLSLNSQQPNQELAIEGSLSGDWCTIDLSSASDRLSLQVVMTAFASRPRFLEALLASRTPKVKVGSDTITLKKYAGMGNATTFPVQSVVFALLAITAITQSEKYLTTEKVVRAARCVRVFGDDIIIRSEYFQELADWINSFGLKINQGKTFTTGNFRESCGVDAYKGVDVTPVYLRHDPEATATDPSAVVSSVSTSNQLWRKCYYETSESIKRSVENSWRSLPLVGMDSEGLGWHSRRDVSTIQRWNRNLHRFEVRTYVPTAETRLDVLDGVPALLKFFHNCSEETPCHSCGRSVSCDFSVAANPSVPEILCTPCRAFVGRSESMPSEKMIAEDHLKHSVRRFTLKLRKRWVQA